MQRIKKKIQTLCKIVIRHEWLNWIPDRPYLYFLYWAYTGKKLNLKTPTTYNEKLQWLKLYDHNEVYSVLVDKWRVKKYVADLIGDEYIIPTLGVWEKPEEITYESLPDRFVLKTTHDSGGIMCIDKSIGFDRKKVIKYFKKRLAHGTYQKQREWPYKKVSPRIIAEEYMEDDETQELRDYKFFCFNGEVKVMLIVTNRQNKEKPTSIDFFDSEFNWIDVRHGRPNAIPTPAKPHNFELMKELAEKLSSGFTQLRVDLYETNEKVYFGELTLFPHGGLVSFEPEKWDYILGDWIDLSRIKNDGERR